MFKLKLFILLIFIFSTSFVENKYSRNQIDNLIASTDEQLHSNKINDVLKNSDIILKSSESIGYDRGILYGNLYLGMVAYMNDNKPKLIEYGFLTESLARQENDSYALAYSLLIKSKIYKSAELYDEALKYVNLALEACDDIKIKDRQHFVRGKCMVYKTICLYYFGATNKKLLELNLQAMKELEKAGKPFNYDYNYVNIATTYENLNKPDSAEYYYHKSLACSVGPAAKGLIYLNLAALAYDSGKLDDALNYNNKSLNILLDSNVNGFYLISGNYELFMNIYKKLGIPEKVKENEKLFNYHQKKDADKDSFFKKKLLIKLIDKAEKEQNEFEKKARKKTTGYISIIIIFVVVLTGLIFIYIKESKKNKHNQEIIKNKRQKLLELNNKVNDAFAEVLELAKKDDPAFITRFKEVYLPFYTQLTTQYPTLNIGQIRFCCLLYLNFSTKEIAHYHHMTIKGVQTKKTRLRKQLNIASDVDLNKWMMELL